MIWRVHLEGRIGALEVCLDLESDARLVVVVGPNGAGKTTLLRAVAGARLPLVGRIEVDGRPLLDLPPELRQVGYLPQGFGLFPHMTVRDNVAFGARRGHDPGTVSEVLARFGLRALAERRPVDLSGGERQRVALARALASGPRCLLLDEPLSALDASSRRGMRGFLADYLESEALPAMVVTHDLRDVLALDGQVVALESGRVIQAGRARDLAAAPATPFLSELFETRGRARLYAASECA